MLLPAQCARVSLCSCCRPGQVACQRRRLSKAPQEHLACAAACTGLESLRAQLPPGACSLPVPLGAQSATGRRGPCCYLHRIIKSHRCGCRCYVCLPALQAATAPLGDVDRAAACTEVQAPEQRLELAAAGPPHSGSGAATLPWQIATVAYTSQTDAGNAIHQAICLGCAPDKCSGRKGCAA